MTYTFPPSLPNESPSDIWKLQTFLLFEAGIRIGKRNSNKIIYQPIFSKDGPFIENKCDGANAALSHNAAGYWPTALYELAHETIHLFDPITGYTNYLEEGIAVIFSVEMSKDWTNHPIITSNETYVKAWELVKKLANNPYTAARYLREKIGPLSMIQSKDIQILFPHIDESISIKLTETCKPR
jgi:hypothetical protein